MTKSFQWKLHKPIPSKLLQILHSIFHKGLQIPLPSSPLTIIHVEIMPPIKTSPVVAIENINVVPSIPGIPPIAPPPAAPQPIAPVKTPTPCGINAQIALATTSIFIMAAGGRCVGRGHIGRGLILVQVIGTIFLCTIVLVVRSCIGSRTVKATWNRKKNTKLKLTKNSRTGSSKQKLSMYWFLRLVDSLTLKLP